MNFQIPEIKIPKSLSKGWKQLDMLPWNLSALRLAYFGIAALAICFAIYFFVDSFSFKYPSLNKEEYTRISNVLNSLVSSAGTNPDHSIQGLSKLGLLPELLENRKNYILAKLYEQRGEKALAFIHYHQITDGYLPRFSKYPLVKIAEEIGDEAIVVSELDSLMDRYPKDPKFVYAMAKSYLRQNQKDKAAETFELVQKQYPDSEYALGSDYYLANLTEDQEEKLQRLTKYLTKSPDGNLATLISDQLIAMSQAGQGDVAIVESLSGKIALSYFYREDYETAVKYFAKQYIEANLHEHAESLVKTRQKSQAIRMLMDRLPAVQDEAVAKKSLEYLLSLTGRLTALANLRVLQPKMQILKDKIQWHIAERTQSKDDYTKVFDNYPKSFYAPESMARVFWMEYKRKAYHRAIGLYKRHWEEYDHSRSHSRVAFWAGKIHLEQGNQEEARAVFQNLIDAHPADFYSFRAQQVLRGRVAWNLLPKSNEYISYPTWDWPQPFTYNEIEQTYGKEILELINIQEFAEVLAFEEDSKKTYDKDFKAWLYARAGDNLKAISTAYFSIPKGTELNVELIKYQYAFPLAYADLVADEVSQRLKVDPMLVHSLIKQESRYQPNIVSKVGAIGLMQMMPYTAKEVARSMNVDTPSTEDLMNPNINIKLGVRYMEDVFRRFDNNMIYAIASYNAGPVAVKQWIRKHGDLDPDLFIEEIPYDETKGYVKKVLENYWIYKSLYT